MDSNKFQHEVEIIVIEKSNIYDWIMVKIFELRVLANIKESYEIVLQLTFLGVS